MIQPCLAFNGVWSWSDIKKYPVGCSPKLDGIRVLTTDKGPLTRTGKQVMNKHIRAQLSTLPAGLDGEVVCEGGFNKTQSCVMSVDGSPQFKYCVFDVWAASGNYVQRMGYLDRVILGPLCLKLLPLICDDESTVKILHEQHIEAGYEGTIIRALDARYKRGRFTLREGGMFKLVDWVRDEAVITGFSENTEHPDRIGAIIGVSDKWGTINVGTGFDLEQSRLFRECSKNFLKKTFRYKYRGDRSKEKPSIPVFESMLVS